MGRFYNPSSVTEGLILYFDAANPKSYPGTGTTWYDLSGNGNNGSMVNGVGYDTTNKGSMVFDGINDYVTVTNDVTSGLNDFAVSTWVYKTEITANRYIFDFGSNGGCLASTASGNFRYYNGTTGISSSLYTSGPLCLINTWFNIVISRISGVTYFYSNSELITSATDLGNIGSWGTTLTIGNYGGGSSYYLQGYLPNILVYKNKGLSALEVKRNFNATRSRYGI